VNKHVPEPPNVEPIRIDWKQPDYAAIFRARIDTLDNIRCAPPGYLLALKQYYREDENGTADFINDWGVTYDPRNAERKLPTIIPFILFPKQRDWITYVIRKWRSQEPGLTEKSRDMGVTWMAISTACTLCLFNEGLTIGFGSRKGEYVDKIGNYKPILPKGRMFMEHLPPEFRGSYTPWRDAPFMRISFPDTGSIITGEGGDDIGRGDRASIYFVDEACHLERPDLVEASLSQTTNCRMDMSSVRGMSNPFAQKRWSGKIEVFIFDWRDDPRKDQAWYDKQCSILDPVVVAQEIDRDYSASLKGIVIPGEWVRAAIGAVEFLGISNSGAEVLAFDVADEGQDKNALAHTKGIEILETEEWSGVGSDTFASTEYVFDVCVERKLKGFRYDADGIGAGVRGDARVLNERRATAKLRPLLAIGYRGSDAVYDPEGIVEGTIGSNGDKGRSNEDFFANRKAQSWWYLRLRFQRTWRWVTTLRAHKEGKIPYEKIVSCDPNTIISINPRDPEHMKLVAELSQATFKTNEAGKIVINKKPDGQKSPNRADAVVMATAPMLMPIEITAGTLAQIRAMGRRGRT